MGGFRKTASVRPGGVNPNDKTVMINPPGRTWGGGVNENFSPAHCQIKAKKIGDTTFTLHGNGAGAGTGTRITG